MTNALATRPQAAVMSDEGRRLLSDLVMKGATGFRFFSFRSMD